MICTQKVGLNKPTMRCRFFIGKQYTIEFKLQVLQPILNRKMSIREAERFYNIPFNALIGTWLKRFEKSDINGMIPRKLSGRADETQICKNTTPTQNGRRSLTFENFAA